MRRCHDQVAYPAPVDDVTISEDEIRELILRTVDAVGSAHVADLDICTDPTGVHVRIAIDLRRPGSARQRLDETATFAAPVDRHDFRIEATLLEECLVTDDFKIDGGPVENGEWRFAAQPVDI